MTTKFIPAADIIIGKGSAVAFYTEDSGVDVSQYGNVSDPAPLDPEGNNFPEVVEVTWEDGEIEYVNRQELVLVLA